MQNAASNLCPRCTGRRRLGCLVCGGRGQLGDGSKSVCLNCHGVGKVNCPVCEGIGELAPASARLGSRSSVVGAAKVVVD
jgi:hypothetical protein